MSSVTIPRDAPAAGVQMNQHFRPNMQPTPTEDIGQGQGTRTRHKPGADASDVAANAITELLGDSITTTNVMSRNLDLQQGYPHSMTGLPYSIQGSAKVISQKVGEYLAKFQDPIKSILSTNIHKESRVIITRKYIVGGRAQITPEHAPARVVSVREDVREVALTRFGADIEMNLNLFLTPQAAKEELDMKVDAQKRELERVLVDTGYETLMTQGVDIVDAIVRSSPLYSAAQGTQVREVVDGAERINVNTIFGALSKHAYAVPNLLAACKYASAYSISNERGTVMILPHGVPDILRWTRQEKAVYSIAGPALLAQTNGKKIDLQMDNAYQDVSTNVKIMVHRQLPTFESGVASPDVPMGALTDEASFGVFYDAQGENSVAITDLVNGSTFDLDQYEEGVYIRPRVVAMMSSAIVAAPGESTGSLLVGYPFTSVSTSSQEIVKIQMRTYIGSVLRQPENVLVLRNVFFEGLVQGHKNRVGTAQQFAADPDKYDLVQIRVDADYLKDHKTCINWADFQDGGGGAAGKNTRDDLYALGILSNSANGKLVKNSPDDHPAFPSRVYRGTTYAKGTEEVLQMNTGHMGNLDHCRSINRLYGAGSFVYDSSPDPMNTRKV